MSDQFMVYVATSRDPFYNLSVENWLFSEVLPVRKQPILYLWQNKPSVVIGRAQNPWTECHLESLLKDNIALVRRQSGGGAVYHDLGNLNYTILTLDKQCPKRENSQRIADVLSKLGIQVNVSERNDLYVVQAQKNYKISGTAFRETQTRSFQHGTLLLNTQKDKLYQYLHHKVDTKLQSKGVASNRASVANLAEISPELKVEKLLKQFAISFGGTCQLLPDNLQIDSIKKMEIELRSWAWLFGKTLPFNHTIAITEFESITLQIFQGRIQKITTNVDLLNLQDWMQRKQPRYCQSAFDEFKSSKQAEKEAINAIRNKIVDIRQFYLAGTGS